MADEIKNSQGDVITGSSSTPAAGSSSSEQNSEVGNVYPDIEQIAVSKETFI